MSERETELVAALESVLTDARYALGQLQAMPAADLCRKVGDRRGRAVDALERIVANATAALEPETAARQDGAAVAG